MRVNKSLFIVVWVGIILALASCAKKDPEIALTRAMNEFQAAVQAKDTDKIMTMLHDQFSAQEGKDRAWAKQTMTYFFMRHKNVQIATLSPKTTFDPLTPTRATVEVETVLTGAENLLPDQAGHFWVWSEWRLVGSKWKLIAVKWTE